MWRKWKKAEGKQEHTSRQDIDWESSVRVGSWKGKRCPRVYGVTDVGSGPRQGSVEKWKVLERPCLEFSAPLWFIALKTIADMDGLLGETADTACSVKPSACCSDCYFSVWIKHLSS